MLLNKKYNNKVVLVTGHTGFKGSWLCIWLSILGAKVIGLSDKISSEPSNYVASNIKSFVKDYSIDIRDAQAVKRVVQECQPDFVFHLAAQSLVRPSYKNPLDTLMVNAIGTANLLDALRILKKPVVAVMITSDKAYENVEWLWGYRETDRIGGKDPYSASKGMAELAIYSYAHSFFNDQNSNVRIGITRAGNVIGGGDWAVDRIVPDCMRAWATQNTIEIRSPFATRPWQHVLEPLSGYLLLGVELSEDIKLHGEAYNFGPTANQSYSVSQLINEMTKFWNNAKWVDTSESLNRFHEAGLLKLNCDKALYDLSWTPTLQFDETVKVTVEWYKHFYQDQNKSMYEFTASQIEDYIRLANERGLSWAKHD